LKPHFLVKLRRRTDVLHPFWGQAIRDKSGTTAGLLPAIDRLLNRHRVPVWVTAEYEPSGQGWTPAEVGAGLDRVYRFVLKENRTLPPQLLRAIRVLPQVDYAQLGQIVSVELPQAMASSAVPRRRKTGSRARASVGLDRAHRVHTRGERNITIAVLDTGIDEDHPELRRSLMKGRGRDFVDIIDGASRFIGDYLGFDKSPQDDWVGHGTHVAGILGAAGIAMPVGVAPDCRILNVRVLGALRQGDKIVGAGLENNINVALKWAVDQGVDVVNMSLGIRHRGGGLPYRDVVDYARRKGVTIVAASGNDGTEALYYPGALPYVITVGAVDETGDVAAFSTFGRQVDLIAPGTEIYSSFLKGGYAFSTGTSHAAPFVAGSAALLKSLGHRRRRSVSDAQVKHALRHTSDKLDRRFKSRKGGYGRLNLPDALTFLNAHL